MFPTLTRLSASSTGAEARESGTEGYLGAFSGAGYARDGGLGFSPEAAPSWDADALFRMDKAGTREKQD